MLAYRLLILECTCYIQFGPLLAIYLRLGRRNDHVLKMLRSMVYSIV